MARRGPLRMIRGEVWAQSSISEMKMKLEVLECGHTIHAPQDFNGEIPGFRRRCGDCAESKPVQYAPEQVAEISARFPQYQYVSLRCVRCGAVKFENKDSAIALKVASGEPFKCGDCRLWERARKKAGKSIE